MYVCIPNLIYLSKILNQKSDQLWSWFDDIAFADDAEIQYGGTFERYIVDNLQSSDNAENHLDHRMGLSNMMLDFQSFGEINLN